MATLLTLVFQGEVTATETLGADEEREVVHTAFPLSPPRDATAHDNFRAYKIAPLTSGRTLISTISNRGDVDDYDRPVLRAMACLMDRTELAGPARDLTAVWTALATSNLEQGYAGLAGQIADRSIHASPEAFALFQTELDRSAEFYARLAAVLIEDSADLYWGNLANTPERVLDLWRPVFGLLPLSRLQQLHLAIGGEATDVREPLLGMPGAVPESWREGGVLSSLFGRKKEPRSEAAADLESQEVFGTRSKGPRALVDAIVDAEPWPTGSRDQERYRVLLSCLDSSSDGRKQTPFDVMPELDELRRAIQRIEQLSSDLNRWP